MPEVRKLDTRRRAVFPERFSPGDLFLEEEISDDRVVFRRIQAAEAPLVEVIIVDGVRMVQGKLDLRSIREAVRLERDSR